MKAWSNPLTPDPFTVLVDSTSFTNGPLAAMERSSSLRSLTVTDSPSTLAAYGAIEPQPVAMRASATAGAANNLERRLTINRWYPGSGG